MSIGRTAYKLGFEISPIILVNGIASNMPWQMLPIVALTDAPTFTTGLLGGSDLTNLDAYFAHWKPLAGSTLISQTIPTYPFANQQTAANAVVAQPLNISMLMLCPVQTTHAVKLASMLVLQDTLAQHNASGGTYIVATPAFIYTNCLLAKVTDVSTNESKQPQYAYQFDFVQPLITISDLEQVYNTLMNRIAGGLPNSTSPTWSGPSIGSNIAGIGANTVPALSSVTGSLASGIGSTISSIG